MEFLLFAVIGLLAIGAAVAMLLSENAVYSALFLIVNFLSVAVLYLMLEAPFLAMVQIAVYAGAIMVLFLFVIMLLGAEKTAQGSENRSFNWLAGAALFGAMSFVFAVGAALASGDVDNAPQPPQEAYLRVVHAAPADAELPDADGNPAQLAIAERRFDVYANGQLLYEGLVFNDDRPENQRFTTLDAGDYTLSFNPAGTEIPFVTAEVNLESAQMATAVLHGETVADLQVSAFAPAVPALERNEGAVTLFNAYTPMDSVDLVQVESPLFSPADDGTGRKVEVLLGDVSLGTGSQSLAFPEGEPENWWLIEAGRAEDILADGIDSGALIQRISELPIVTVEDQRAGLYVVAAGRGIGGVLEPTIIARSYLADSVFGGPAAVGRQLFTVYVLPLMLVAILLLAAMIGVIVMTMRTERVVKPSRSLRHKVSRPLTSVIAAQTGTDLGPSETAAPRITAGGTGTDEAEDQPEPAGD